ncbi:MAG TPA: hypothetical protein VF538_09535 [Pyrinomonadaceae bacterium]
MFSVTIDNDDYSLIDLGPDFAPGREVAFVPADAAPDDVLALIKVIKTGDHHIGFYTPKGDGSVCIYFANSNAPDPYDPLCFENASEVQVVGVRYNPPR